MAEPARADARYTAFLSYSHTDAAAAARLHRRLEAYRIPARLVGTETPRGPVPRRLWPIFRDREELPAASDLSETVRAALAESGALIILCSPAAADSLWVAEEIETFRGLHPDRPILAAILDGDPPGCFPQALRAFGQDGTWHEPLATDLRPGKDGNHLGLLKLVAGITGLGLDDLVQRDATRRVRRVTAVTGVAVIAMLVMAALAAVAVQARREADRQRAEAEGQIEFMLTDLRARLRSVGRLDIMTAVNQHALAYYGRQALEDLPPDSLERRARILHAIGEDNVARGNLDAALAAFEQAHRTTAEQLARAPNDPQRIFDHGQSDYWVGRIYELRRDWPRAQRQYDLYAGAADRLISIAPNNPDYLMEAGYGASNIGTVQLKGYHAPAAAEASFRTALYWFERAEQARPGDRIALRKQANAYANIADTYYARAQVAVDDEQALPLWAQALRARQQQYAIYLPLYQASPDDMELLYELATAERAVGRQLSILSGVEERIARRRRLPVAHERNSAEPYFRNAYQHARFLTDHDPRNITWLLFKVTLECDFLQSSPRQSGGLSTAQLRNNVAVAAAELEAQHNPSVTQISNCLVHH